MFDWFWLFLYQISRGLFWATDMVMECVNKLAGIEPININDEEIDFLTYLITGDNVKFAFAACALIGIALVVALSVIAILRTIVKEKPEASPIKIVIQAGKNILLFMFVPFIMLTSTYFVNILMQSIFKATMVGATSIGSFMFVSFGQDAGLSENETSLFLDGTLDYNTTSDVMSAINISDYQFILSWIVGIIVLFAVAGSLLKFVERAIAIVVLFIIAPFPIGSSVIDEGSRFKAWRDQVLSKFLVAFGLIIAINIYCLIVGLIMKPGFGFFEPGSLLNYVAKVLFIVGGATSLNKFAQLIGNIISPGTGGQELADADLTKGASKVMGMGAALGGLATLKPLRNFATGILKEASAMKQRDLGGRMLKSLGMGIKDNGQTNKDGIPDSTFSSNSNKQKGQDMSQKISNSGQAADNKKDEDNKNDKKPDNNGNDKMKNLLENNNQQNTNNNQNNNNQQGGDK